MLTHLGKADFLKQALPAGAVNPEAKLTLVLKVPALGIQAPQQCWQNRGHLKEQQESVVVQGVVDVGEHRCVHAHVSISGCENWAVSQHVTRNSQHPRMHAATMPKKDLCGKRTSSHIAMHGV